MIDDKAMMEALHSAYTLIRSVEVNRSGSALTLDHLLGEAVRSIESGVLRENLDARGESAGTRISKLDRLAALEKSLLEVVQVMEQEEQS